MSRPSRAGVLRTLLAAGPPVVAPGVFDGLSARLAEQAGFSALYASGGAIARSAGLPDLGLLSATEMLERIRVIVEATGLPVVADADTGYGGPLNVARTVAALERAGVAALHLEDQAFPKRCGHLDGKRLVSTGEMCARLRAARDGLSDPDTVLIARTDAIAVEGIEGALARAAAYREAGADMAFVEAPTTTGEIEAVARLPGWKMLNMFDGGRTPLVPLDRLEALGFQLVIVPGDLQRAALHAMRRALLCLKQHGHTAPLRADMASFEEREAVVGTAAMLERERRCGKPS
ncbi:MAG TPA: oxaloacetate decarboxylase [Azospirillaceae bacterium]|nr:oxaloacetate decarboxylase [Azospirillaceae bacterium]